MKTAISSTLPSLLLAALMPLAAAGQPGPPQPVSWSMKLAHAETPAKAGAPFAALVTVTLEDGWHIYAADEVPDGPRPLVIALVEKSPFRPAGSLKAPDPERDMDESFGQVTAFYKANTTFRLPVAVSSGVPAGAHDLLVDVSFQACNGRLCLPARVARLKASVSVIK